jgi:LmbE family N-acetylglucosaminyl deacetylase
VSDRGPLDLGSILGVWAHPDDETTFSGGVMANAVRMGRRVVCVTATRGEHSTLGAADSPEELAAQREQELERSLSALGVTEHSWLDYEDGGLARVPRNEAVERVVEFLRRVQPDTVLSFGPDGMTGHADHVTVSLWARAAFEQSGKPGARLLQATMTDGWVERFLDPINRWNVFKPGMPPRTPLEKMAVDFEVPPDLMDRKLEAMRAHESQFGPMFEELGEEFMREAHGREWFRLAAER